MKRLVLILLLIAVPAFAVDTTLTTPLTIVAPATIMKQYSFTIVPTENKVRASMKFVDASSNEVQVKECEFTDSAVTNAIIQAGKVGQKYIDVLMQSIQTKCKTQWSLTGTDN